MAKIFTSGGRAGKPAPRKNQGGAGRKKGGTAGKVALAVVTCCNLVLSLLLALLRRQEIIHAVRENDEVKVLVAKKGKTEGK